MDQSINIHIYMAEATKNNRIDYSKYEVDEVAETISDAIFFPLYIGKVLGLTVLIASVVLFVYAYFQNEYTLLVILLFLLPLANSSILSVKVCVKSKTEVKKRSRQTLLQLNILTWVKKKIFFLTEVAQKIYICFCWKIYNA